jgi:hypothetical protein
MNKSSISKLSKTIKGLKSLLKEKFKILRITKYTSVLTDADWCYGDPARATAKVECPLCAIQFKATIRSDLLGSTVDPDSCPNPKCDFSNNVV